MPRKFIHHDIHQNDEPIPLNQDQKYAIVTKALGAGNFNAHILPLQQPPINIIAKTTGAMKFRKKKNFVNIHSIILIQLRSFNQNKNNIADILHIYKNTPSELLHFAENYSTIS